MKPISFEKQTTNNFDTKYLPGPSQGYTCGLTSDSANNFRIFCKIEKIPFFFILPEQTFAGRNFRDFAKNRTFEVTREILIKPSEKWSKFA